MSKSDILRRAKETGGSPRRVLAKAGGDQLRRCKGNARRGAISAWRATEPLEQLQEFFYRDVELPKDLEEQGRPDFAAAVERNRNRPAVRVVPSLVTSGLSRL
jgi:hypothetical protein